MRSQQQWRQLVLRTTEKHWLIISLITLGGITVLSLIPLNELPEMPGSDKTHHLVAYAILAYPTSLKRPKGWQNILIFFAIYGGMIELIQPLVNRHGEWVDLIANTTGLMVGCLIAILTIQIKAKNSKP
ncbi:VanZ family protein [Synechococcus sp. MIT S9507]|uniref:VanZ family protein n=1 Tax=Synechococcus sp. MIT S9507 TaxID=3082544 RepID=UPI0039B3A86B